MIEYVVSVFNEVNIEMVSKLSPPSIENKLQAEQDAMRMEFVLQQEKFEAERKIIEALPDDVEHRLDVVMSVNI